MKETDEATNDPCEAASALCQAKIACLKQVGRWREPDEEADEEEIDDYSDAMTAVYKEACAELGLPWPPLLEEVE